MSSDPILEPRLPRELLEHIFTHSSKADLKIVRLLRRDAHESITQRLFDTVHVDGTSDRVEEFVELLKSSSAIARSIARSIKKVIYDHSLVGASHLELPVIFGFAFCVAVAVVRWSGTD